MAVLETKHTLSAFNKMTKDLLKAIKVVACISMFAFLAYYIYLIMLNLDRMFYIVIYSCLTASIVFFFLIEVFIKEEGVLLKNKKRLLIEKKRKWKNLIKFLKFTAKTTLVATAIYETASNPDFSLPNILNVCSALLLIFQVAFEFVVHYIVKQFDYFRLAIGLDVNESSAPVQSIYSAINHTNALQEDAINSLGEALHTPEEEKMIAEIKIEAKKYKEKKDKLHSELEEIIKFNKKRRIKFPFIKLKKK